MRGGLTVAPSAAAVAPAALWGAWALDPSTLALVAATVLAYAHTVRGLWHSGGRGAGIREAQVAWFGLGVVAVLVALVSPLEALAGSLFAAHMVQHLLLTLVAAPLLLLDRVHLGLLPLLPVSWRRDGARMVAKVMRARPALPGVAAVALHVGTLLPWHVPGLYDAAVAHPGLGPDRTRGPAPGRRDHVGARRHRVPVGGRRGRVPVDPGRRAPAGRAAPGRAPAMSRPPTYRRPWTGSDTWDRPRHRPA